MTVFDPNNLAAEEGQSNTDRRHRFVTSFHYAPSISGASSWVASSRRRERPADRRDDPRAVA